MTACCPKSYPLPWGGMNSNSPPSQPSPRVPGQPRVFAIVYLGRGLYGLDILEAPRPARRLRIGKSTWAMRKCMQPFQEVGDLIVMSEPLRALEALECDVPTLMKLEEVLGDPFKAIRGELEQVVDLNMPIPPRRLKSSNPRVRRRRDSPPKHRLVDFLPRPEAADGDCDGDGTGAPDGCNN